MERHSRQLQPKHQRAIFHNGRIAHKDLYHLRGKKSKYRHQYKRHSSLKKICKLQSCFQPCAVSRAVIVSGQRLSTKGKTNQDQRSDHINFHNDSHSCNLIVTKSQQRAVCQRNSDALHQISNRSRNTNGKNRSDLRPGNVKSPGIHRKIFALFNKKPYKENIGTNISDHGRCSCAGRTPAQYKDHDRIQDDIDNSTDDCSHHTDPCKALSGNEGIHAQYDQDKKTSQNIDSGIVRCVC